MFKLIRKVKLMQNRSGSGSVTVRVTLPKDIVDFLEVSPGEDVFFSCSGFGKQVFLTKEEPKSR